MKVADAILLTERRTGQTFDQSIFLRWLSELDGQIAFDVFGKRDNDPYIPADLDKELYVPGPWDGLYVPYLSAKVYFANGEYERYANETAMYNEMLADFRKNVQRSKTPCGMVTIRMLGDGGSGVLSIIAPVEHTLTASQAYAVGEYFVYDNRLWCVTVAIESGGEIIPDTNCTETSVCGVIEGYDENEAVRVANENQRISNESARVTAESGRVTAESGRASAEASRVTAENGRVSAEAARVTAENGRVSAEASRVAAETARESTETGYVAQAAAKATLSESWAVGGTGTRSGEDTNNAKFWSEQAQSAAGGGVTSWNNRSGVVLPQSGDYAPYMVGAAPNRNFLINSIFKYGNFPINQRGDLSYVGEKWGISGWKNWSAQTSTEITSNGLRVYRTAGSSSTGTKNAVQIVTGLEQYAGQQLTVSALVHSATDGQSNSTASLVAFQGTDTTTFPGGSSVNGTYAGVPFLLTKTITLPNDFEGTLNVHLRAPSGTGEVTFIAAKLEPGDKQTLVQNIGTAANPQWILCDIPDYQTELLRCQRYERVIKTSHKYGIFGLGQAYRSNKLTIPIDCSNMRVVPTVTASGSFRVSKTGGGSDTSYPVTDISKDNYSSTSSLLIVATIDTTSDSMVQGESYFLQANNDTSAKIIIDANIIN